MLLRFRSWRLLWISARYRQGTRRVAAPPGSPARFPRKPTPPPPLLSHSPCLQSFDAPRCPGASRGLQASLPLLGSGWRAGWQEGGRCPDLGTHSQLGVPRVPSSSLRLSLLGPSGQQVPVGQMLAWPSCRQAQGSWGTGTDLQLRWPPPHKAPGTKLSQRTRAACASCRDNDQSVSSLVCPSCPGRQAGPSPAARVSALTLFSRLRLLDPLFPLKPSQ